MHSEWQTVCLVISLYSWAPAGCFLLVFFYYCLSNITGCLSFVSPHTGGEHVEFVRHTVTFSVHLKHSTDADVLTSGYILLVNVFVWHINNSDSRDWNVVCVCVCTVQCTESESEAAISVMAAPQHWWLLTEKSAVICITTSRWRTLAFANTQ